MKAIYFLLALMLLTFFNSESQDLQKVTISSIGGQDYVSLVNDVEYIPSDNSKIIAYTHGEGSFKDRFGLMKINDNGTIAFNKNYSFDHTTNTSHFICKELVYKNGNLFALFSTKIQTNNDNYEPIVAKIDATNGEVIYANIYTGYQNNKYHTPVGLYIGDPIYYINGDIISVISYGYDLNDAGTVTMNAKGYFTIHITDPNFSGASSSFSISDILNRNGLFFPTMLSYTIANQTTAPQIKCSFKGVYQDYVNYSTRRAFESNFSTIASSIDPNTYYGNTYSFRVNNMPLANYSDMGKIIIGQNILEQGNPASNNIFLITRPPSNLPLDGYGYTTTPYIIPYYDLVKFEYIPDYKKIVNNYSSGQVPISGRFIDYSTNSFGRGLGSVGYSTINNQVSSYLASLNKYKLRTFSFTNTIKNTYDRSIQFPNIISSVALRSPETASDWNKFYFWQNEANSCKESIPFSRNDKFISYATERQFKVKYSPVINIEKVNLTMVASPNVIFEPICAESILHNEKEFNDINKFGKNNYQLYFSDLPLNIDSWKTSIGKELDKSQLKPKSTLIDDKISIITEYSILRIKSSQDFFKSILIYNSLGQLMKKESNISSKEANISISNFIKGVYILKIIGVDNKITVRKFLKISNDNGTLF